ncbi:MAG: hypothetical protein K2H43_05785, partial [Clostridia bacterium]|nr:hypothetical protein [Clostridia bacterium]
NVTAIELDYPDYLEVTGKFAETPPPADTTDPKNDKSNTGLIVGLSVGGAVIVVGAVAAAIIVAKKKKS